VTDVLERITPEEQSRIVADAADDPRTLCRKINDIKAALTVYGASRDGPFNDRNEPQHEINPKFMTIGTTHR